MARTVKIAGKTIGDGYPCFVIAEIGINHNGSLELAKRIIDIACATGCDAVKFQKRTVDVVYTKEELERERKSVFGTTNGDLKRGLEFGYDEYKEIDRYCREKGILWFASCWDEQSVDFIDQFNPPCYKIASASLTDDNLLKYTKSKGKPILLSTGMSTMNEVRDAFEVLQKYGAGSITLLHCTTDYPCPYENVNMKAMLTIKEKFNLPVGYSDHTNGTEIPIMAVSMGATIIEKHFTLDKKMKGPDHKTSLEPQLMKS